MIRPSATIVLLFAVLAGPGCVVAEGCDAVCEAARPTWELCMAQWGLAYDDGITSYTSADDYDGWCATYNRERRLLASTADDPDAAEAALTARCERQTADLESEDCSLYYAVFSEPPPE